MTVMERIDAMRVITELYILSLNWIGPLSGQNKNFLKSN